MLAADGAATAAPLSLGFVWRVGREATRHTEEPWNPPCGTLLVEPSLFAIWWPQHPTVADQDGIGTMVCCADVSRPLPAPSRFLKSESFVLNPTARLTIVHDP